MLIIEIILLIVFAWYAFKLFQLAFFFANTFIGLIKYLSNEKS
jgi:hypothetical protein